VGTVSVVGSIFETRGFAFVTMANARGPEGRGEVPRHQIEGRALAVNIARPAEERPPGGGGVSERGDRGDRGGGRGGRGGGGGYRGGLGGRRRLPRRRPIGVIAAAAVATAANNRTPIHFKGRTIVRPFFGLISARESFLPIRIRQRRRPVFPDSV